ncbi:TetR family transcriptional regulator [Microbacterium sp.]|uniref:TetR family transcriptional regulator n=1 Tax=Microbacterium sp. TaxID=51671 RepID=UPI0039E3D0F3
MAGRGPYAKGLARRAEILSAALDVVAENGYSRSYVNDIAERVGLTHTGLMHYFASREELYEEVIRARDVSDRTAYTTGARGVEGYFAVIEHNRHVPGLVQLYAEFSADAAHPGHPSHAFFVERYAYLREALARDVELAQADGAMGATADPTEVAELLIATADGLQVQWLHDHRIDMAGRLRALWRALCLASHVRDAAREDARKGAGDD